MTKEQWVARFEEANGRKPSPQEFLQGKKTGFDISQFEPATEEIYDVAEEDISEPPVSDTVYDIAEELPPTEKNADIGEEIGEQKPVVPPVQASTSSNLAQQQQWVATFEKYVGRKPGPQEFVVGKESGFDLKTIHQFLPQVQQTPPQNNGSAPSFKPARKPMSTAKKILIAIVVVIIAAGAAGYMYGSQYFSQQAVAERYLQAVKAEPSKAIEEYEVWSDTKAPITKNDIRYLNVDQRQSVKSDDLLDDGNMVQAGNQFLVFPNWKVAVKPVSATIAVNTKGLSVSLNGKEVEKSTGDSYKKTLNHLYPGTYTFTAKGKVEGQDVEVSSEEKLTKNTNVDLNVKYLSFTVQSNLSDGDVYVGSKKVGTLQDGRLDINRLAVTSAASVYVQKGFSDSDSVKSETYSIGDIYDGDTITVDAKGILDRDVANDVVESAYYKLQSYASSHTTPDGLNDVFSGGVNNKFYADVKNTIDTNTTGAKVRSADSISFKDVDVTKVTQTGPKTYSVEFTVVYDFYYRYSSEQKSSGDITQTLSWSANIEYVGDKNNEDSYVSSKDYRITSSAGDSKVLKSDNTVK